MGYININQIMFKYIWEQKNILKDKEVYYIIKKGQLSRRYKF